MSGWLLRVRVTPRAARDEVVGWDGDLLHVRVTAPPAEGKANEACRELLARALGVARSQLQLVQGAHHREKVFRVGEGSPQMLERLRKV